MSLSQSMWTLTLLGKLQDNINRLVEFEDIQAATYRVASELSIVRAVHFMRTAVEGASGEVQFYDP